MRFMLRITGRLALLLILFVSIRADANAASESEKAKNSTKVTGRKTSGFTSYKTCEEFMSAFKSKYEYAYELENYQCEASSENGAAFVLKGNWRSGRKPIAKFYYVPSDGLVLYEDTQFPAAGACKLFCVNTDGSVIGDRAAGHQIQS